jgi:mRNA interferase RelE/StbE
MPYEVRIAPAAERDIAKLATKIQGLVLAALDDLAGDPRPEGARKLRGLPRQFEVYRIVVARNYRVVYQVRDEAAWVLVLRARDRKDVYKRVDDLKRLLGR